MSSNLLDQNQDSGRRLPKAIISPQFQTSIQGMMSLNQSVKHHPKNIKNLTLKNYSDKDPWSIITEQRELTTALKNLKKDTRVLQNLKFLTNLDLVAQSKIVSDLTYGLSELKKLNHISTLDLKLIHEHHLSPSNIRLLSRSLANLKNLTSFSLETPSYYNVSPQFINSIGFALKHIPSLSRLSISFKTSLDFDDSLIKQLASRISKLTQLKGLALNFERSIGITNEGLRCLSPIFERLSLLSDVSIKILNSQGTSLEVSQEFFSGLNRLKSLEKLSLSIKPKINENFMNQMFGMQNQQTKTQEDPVTSSLGILDAHKLREISLDFFTEFNDTHLIELSQSLQKFSSLKKLTIDFNRITKVSDQSLAEFGSALQNLTSLSSLDLILVGNSQLSQDIEIISQSLSSLTKLKTLSLKFSGFTTQNRASIQTLSSSLQQLKDLKNLSLSAVFCNLDDQSIDILMEGLKSLTSLELDITYNKEVTNEGIKSLMKGLSSCPSLKDLKLILKDNNVDVEALGIIARGLQQMSGLYSLDIVFRSSNQPSEGDGVEILVDAIQNLTSLRKVHLQLGKVDIVKKRIGQMKHNKTVTTSFQVQYG